MKNIRKFITIATICGLSLAVSACSTISCGDAKVLDDGKIVVTATQSSGGAFVGGLISGLGQSLNIPLPSGALGQAGRALKDNVLSDAEKAAIAKAAQPEAEKFIKKNPKLFCDKCKSGEPCAVTKHDVELELVDYNVQQRGRKKIITLIFKIKEAKIACGPCPECQVAVADSADATVLADADVALCDSEPQIVIEGEPYDATLVLDALGGDLGAFELEAGQLAE